MSSPKSLANRLALAQKLVSGIQQNLASQPTLNLDGKSTPTSNVVSTCTAFIEAVTAAEAAKTAYSSAVQAQDAALAAFEAVHASMQRFLVSNFGPKNPVLTSFGLTPKKVASPLVLVKAAALVKREATRQARHTMGKKQKAKITGQNVEAAVATSASAPEPGPSPSGAVKS